MKPTDLRILVMLGAYQPISVNEVSRRTHVDKAWISRSLAGLLRRKLIRRVAHPSDSRAALLLPLTPKGEALLREIAPVAERYQRQLLQGSENGTWNGFSICCRSVPKKCFSTCNAAGRVAPHVDANGGFTSTARREVRSFRPRSLLRVVAPPLIHAKRWSRRRSPATFHIGLTSRRPPRER